MVNTIRQVAMRKTDLFKTNVGAKDLLFSIFCALLVLQWLAKLLWSIAVEDVSGTNIILGFGLCCNAKFEWWHPCIKIFVLTLVLSSLCLLLLILFIVLLLWSVFCLFLVEFISFNFFILCSYGVYGIRIQNNFLHLKHY